MENIGIIYDHLVYFTAIGNILFPFGIFCGNLVYFSPFWYFGPRKIWQLCSNCKRIAAVTHRFPPMLALIRRRSVTSLDVLLGEAAVGGKNPNLGSTFDQKILRYKC
jgi:hypothetical protein